VAKGVAREGTARWVHEGLRDKGGGGGRGWPSEPATRNSARRVGREGGKKSDKTMERNLNYAPRKMAIVCKAMLILREGEGRGEGRWGGRRPRRRRRRPFAARRSFFPATGIYLLLFFFSSTFFLLPPPPPAPVPSPSPRVPCRVPSAHLACIHLSFHFPLVLPIRLCSARVSARSPQFRAVINRARASRRARDDRRRNRGVPLFKRARTEGAKRVPAGFLWRAPRVAPAGWK